MHTYAKLTEQKHYSRPSSVLVPVCIETSGKVETASWLIGVEASPVSLYVDDPPISVR
jgi:hypothetical protein